MHFGEIKFNLKKDEKGKIFINKTVDPYLLSTSGHTAVSCVKECGAQIPCFNRSQWFLVLHTPLN